MLKNRKIKIIILVVLIMTVSIGIVLYRKSGNKKVFSEVPSEVSTEISNYLKSKYGQNTDFKILNINKEKQEITGDGYPMGTDKEPVVILSYTDYEATVRNKSYNITFLVNYNEDNKNETKSISDNFEELLVNKLLTDQFLKVDKRISISMNQNKIIKKSSYGHIPELNEIIGNYNNDKIYNAEMIFSISNIKKEFRNYDDIFNFIKNNMKEYLRVFESSITNKSIGTLTITLKDTTNTYYDYKLYVDFENKSIYTDTIDLQTNEPKHNGGTRLYYIFDELFNENS